MHTQHPCAARRARLRGAAEAAEDIHQLGVGRGHGRGQQAGGAVAGVQARHGVDGVAAVHHVRAAAAVHMQIDKAGQDIGGVIERGIGGLPDDAGDPALFGLDPAEDPALGRQDIAADGE